MAHKKSSPSKKMWIAGAIKKPGSLRKALKIKKGKDIPKTELKKVAKGKGINAKRARLALTLEGFHQDKKSKKSASKKSASKKVVEKKKSHTTLKKRKERKISRVMREFKAGDLPIGKSRMKVKNKKQALAIAFSEASKLKKKTSS